MKDFYMPAESQEYVQAALEPKERTIKYPRAIYAQFELRGQLQNDLSLACGVRVAPPTLSE